MKVCPECLSVTSNKANCEHCGFPFSKKIIGQIEDHYFYEIIHMYNSGHREEALNLANSKNSEIPSPKISLLLEKIKFSENLIFKANRYEIESLGALKMGDIENAYVAIRAAKEIYQDLRFDELESKINSASKRNSDEEKAKELNNKFKNGNWNELQSLSMLNEACKLSPDNQEFIENYKYVFKNIASHIENKLSIKLDATQKYELEILISSLSIYADDFPEIRHFQNQLFNIQENENVVQKKRKRIYYILGFGIIIIASWFFITKYQQNQTWQIAQSRNTISSIDSFILKNPESPYLDEAKNKIKYLTQKDSLHWINASKNMTISSIKNYLDSAKNINGKYQNEANIVLDSLEWLSIKDKTEASYFETYIVNHPNSKYIDQARLKLSLNVSEIEKESLYTLITQYFSLFGSKDMETLMGYFDPIIKRFVGSNNITKADLRLLIENDLRTIVNSRFIIDKSSFKVTRGEDGNYYATFFGDRYITRIRDNNEDEDTSITYFNTGEYYLTINSNKKITSYRYKIISEQPINQ